MDGSKNKFSEDSNNEIVPDNLKEISKFVALNLLPRKSKQIYTAAYNTFKKWRKENKSNSFCEDVLMAYFAKLSTKYAPPSLWATYSMLKCTINTYDHIDIGRYNKLTAFLKKNSLGYRPKKSPVFSRESISTFLNEAPDDMYLCEKVALIFGISGGLRREEFVNITVDDVKIVEDCVLLVQVPKTQNYVPRSFTITKELFAFCWKYRQARPENCSVDNFFLRYTKGTCIQQAVGINKFGSMPRYIAEYLHLPNAGNFTGHSFRRTSATLLVGDGANTTMFQRHGVWKSAKVASGYIADSVNDEKKICETITDGTEIKKEIETVVVDTILENGPSKSGLNSSANISDEESGASTTSLLETKVELSNNIDELSDPLVSEIQSDEPKGAILNHPDKGTYIHNYTNEAPRSNYTFNNCNVTLNSSSGNFTFNNCTTQRMCLTANKAVQTDKTY